jgi:hypothetical protein
MDRKKPSLIKLFRRPKPEGKFSLAHPLREPVRAVGQSFVLWPAAALTAIMYAAPQEGTDKPAIVVLVLQITVLYPIIAGVAFICSQMIAKAGHERASLLPLIVPLAIMGLWALVLILFAGRYLASVIAHLASIAGIG